MINEKYAKSYCCEELSLIENYELAIADTTQMWEIHHRRGTIYSKKDLKEIGEYYNRPAAELIFLTPTAHRLLHFKGVPRPDLKGVPRGPMSEANKKAISEAKKGIPFSEAHKKALSDALKGHSVSEATKKAIAEAQSKKIMQLTKSGEFIKEWPSIREASRQLKINCGNICSCCNGIIKSAGGFIWKYPEHS